MKPDKARKNAFRVGLAVENGDDPQELKKRLLRTKSEEGKNSFSSIAESTLQKPKSDRL